MSRLPIYSNVSRWVFSGGRSSQKEPEYGYANYVQDWSTTYMRPYQPSAGRYDRVSGYLALPYGYASDPGYMHVNACYPEAVYYSGRAPRFQYVTSSARHNREYEADRGYEKPITAREKEQQRQKERQKQQKMDEKAKPKKFKTKSNKKIQMYRSFNPLEPPVTSESNYPTYMIPKRRISYQNYMQESSFYGDEDDPTLESGSLGQGYHHWQHDPGLYRLRRIRHSSSSTHTSYENNKVGSDIEEETTFDTNFDEEKDTKDKTAVKTAEKVVYANTEKVRRGAVAAETSEKAVYANSETIKKYEDEATQTQTFEDSNETKQVKQFQGTDETSQKRSFENINETTQTQSLEDDQASIQKLEMDNTWKEPDYETTGTGSVSNTRNLEIDFLESRQSFDHSDWHVPKTNYENIQKSASEATEKAENVPYENVGTSKVSEIDSFQNIIYANTGIERLENPPRKYVSENIHNQTPTEQDIQASWTDIYDNINPSELVRTEIQKRTEYQYIHPTAGAHYKVADLGNINRREYSELEMHAAASGYGNRKEYSELETDGENLDRRGYSEFETDSVNRKEYSELDHVIQEANRDFDRLSGERLEQTPGYLAYAVSPTMDHFIEPYQNEATNVRHSVMVIYGLKIVL